MFSQIYVLRFRLRSECGCHGQSNIVECYLIESVIVITRALQHW